MGNYMIGPVFKGMNLVVLCKIVWLEKETSEGVIVKGDV